MYEVQLINGRNNLSGEGTRERAADTARKMLLLYSGGKKNVQSLNLVVQTRAANCYGQDFADAGDLF